MRTTLAPFFIGFVLASGSGCRKAPPSPPVVVEKSSSGPVLAEGRLVSPALVQQPSATVPQPAPRGTPHRVLSPLDPDEVVEQLRSHDFVTRHAAAETLVKPSYAIEGKLVLHAKRLVRNLIEAPPPRVLSDRLIVMKLGASAYEPLIGALQDSKSSRDVELVLEYLKCIRVDLSSEQIASASALAKQAVKSHLPPLNLAIDPVAKRSEILVIVHHTPLSASTLVDDEYIVGVNLNSSLLDLLNSVLPRKGEIGERRRQGTIFTDQLRFVQDRMPNAPATTLEYAELHKYAREEATRSEALKVLHKLPESIWSQVNASKIYNRDGVILGQAEVKAKAVELLKDYIDSLPAY